MSVEIIAELACNHMGDIELAKKQMRFAKKAGVDTVKFQAYVTDLINDPSLKDFLTLSWLSSEDFTKLKDYAYEQGLDFLVSAFDVSSAKMLKSIGCQKVKIPSGQHINPELLEYAAEKFKTIYISFGISTEPEIKDILNFLARFPQTKIIPMHCVTSYPCRAEDAHLLTSRLFKGYKWGYSDHCMVNLPALLAVAMGASVIEHHFGMETHTPDSPVNFTPEQLKDYCRQIREAEKIIGQSGRAIWPCENSMKHRRYKA